MNFANISLSELQTCIDSFMNLTNIHVSIIKIPYRLDENEFYIIIDGSTHKILNVIPMNIKILPNSNEEDSYILVDNNTHHILCEIQGDIELVEFISDFLEHHYQELLSIIQNK